MNVFAGAAAEDQAAAIDLLASPSTYGGAAVERIDTHTAVVFLAGKRAYKLKRAVRFDYLDYSTAEKRRMCCEAELRLNQRTAPGLYQRVAAVTRARDGSLALDGTGAAVDWVVEMQRFPQDALFDRLAERGRLDLALMAPLAEAIASFHASAERRDDHGGRAGMRWVVDGNAEGFAEFGRESLPEPICQRVTDRSIAAVDRHGALLDARRAQGLVRQCHGDLHLRNIVLLDGRPTLFDGVEFNDEITCIDVHYDVAFLLMDLWHRQLHRHANLVWNRYVSATRDLEAVPLLPLFLACRAAVRAKTSATAARFQSDDGRRARLDTLAREYLTLADACLSPPPPRLIAVGGRSGSGKSTLAWGLAPLVGAVPGAVVLRSDDVRKELCGASPLDRLGPEGYTPAVSEQVYRTMAARAETIVRGGHSVIADAVFLRSADRESIERVAGSAFAGLWLEAPEDTLVARVTERRGDPSDADADVVRRQRTEGAVGWRPIDASRSADAVLQLARGHLGTLRPPPEEVG